MSAFLVDKTHIDMLVTTLLQGPRGRVVSPGNAWTLPLYLPGCDNPETQATHLGRLLWTENVRSLQARYPRDASGERPGPIGVTDDDVSSYRYTDPRYRPTLAEAVGLLNCYEYQACEHDEWEASQAHGVCRRLADTLLRAIPGVSDAPWEWTPSTLASRKVKVA